MASEYSRKRQGQVTTVQSQAAQSRQSTRKWQSWWRLVGHRPEGGWEPPRCSGKLWVLSCDPEQMGGKKSMLMWKKPLYDLG